MPPTNARDPLPKTTDWADNKTISPVDGMTPTEVWTQLTESQKKSLFQTLVRLCCQLSQFRPGTTTAQGSYESVEVTRE